MLSPRSTSLGFADRTTKNLVFIEAAFQRGEEDVHLVTQIVNSLLGLVVFPWESGIEDRIAKTAIDAPALHGWPQWNISEGRCDTVGELMRKLRNGIAHRHINFSSDSRVPEEVSIQIEDYSRGKGHARNFAASIRADDLAAFCLKFAALARTSSVKNSLDAAIGPQRNVRAS